MVGSRARLMNRSQVGHAGVDLGTNGRSPRGDGRVQPA
jgi:hypothetical protein